MNKTFNLSRNHLEQLRGVKIDNNICVREVKADWLVAALPATNQFFKCVCACESQWWASHIQVSGVKVLYESVNVLADLWDEVCVCVSKRVARKHTEPKVKDLLLLLQQLHHQVKGLNSTLLCLLQLGKCDAKPKHNFWEKNYFILMYIFANWRPAGAVSTFRLCFTASQQL